MCSVAYPLVLFAGTLLTALACHQYVSTVCRCEDLHNGVLLNCSNTDGVRVMEVIRANQANLGLIQYLELQNAKLKRIPGGFFSGLYIKKLDLSQNELEQVDVNAFLGMSNILQELLLNRNKLVSLPAASLAPLSTLLKLDLSNNSLADLRSENALPYLPKLYDINLADNRICEVHKSVFEEVKNSVQTINLGRNCLTAVPASAIRGFKQLVALHLHANNISALDALSFMNLPSMTLLNLAANKITTIHRQAFLNVPNLRYLYLTGNRIGQIYPYQFSSFEQLEMLDFSGNYLLQLPTDGFSNLQNLRQLYLGENRIADIQNDSFANSSIVILVLSSNRLTELREGMFRGMAKLQQISVKDNQIRSIEQNVFYGNPSLAMVDLSENELIDVPPAIFISQLNIFLVDLSKNKIVRTPYGAFNRRVKTVLMQENPLVCTEKVHMLEQGVGVYVPNSEDEVCGGKKSSTNGTSTEDLREAIRLAEEESFTPTDPLPNLATFVQEEKNAMKTQASVIHPLSTIKSQEAMPNGGYARPNVEGLIPVRPINAPANVQFAGVPTSTDGAPQRVSVTSDHDHHEAPNTEGARLNIEPIASRTRGNFGLGKMRNRTELTESPDLVDLEWTFNKSSTASFQPSTSTENRNVIHPFPVPFLSRPPKMFPSYAVSTTPLTPQTLPPSIVIAQPEEGSSINRTADINRKFEQFELEARTAIPKKIQEVGEQFPYEVDPNDRIERMAAPSIIIIVCLSTVAIVMGAVFVGLCIAKHRRMQYFGGSSSSSAAAARTHAYVAAQAAQMNMIYGTAHRNRNLSTLNTMDDGHAWIYAPGSYSNSYYK